MVEEQRQAAAAYRARERELMQGAAHSLFRSAWWAIALRGLLAIVLAILILGNPGASLVVLLTVLGIYIFMDGLFALVATFHAAQEKRSWWPYLLQGLVSIGVGILVFARPPAAALGLLLLVAVRSVVTGGVEISAAVALRRASGISQWPLWLGGLASIAFGLLIVARPVAGIFTLVWLAGIYCLFFGITEVITAFRARSLGERVLAMRTQ